MVRPNDVLEAVERSLKNSDKVPSGVSYLTEKPDVSDNADVPVPFVAIWFASNIKSNPHNTMFRGFAEDEDGNHIGYLFDGNFESRIQIELWSVDGDGVDPHFLGTAIHLALAKHDSKGYSQPFLDENGDPLWDFHHFLKSSEEEFVDGSYDAPVRGWRSEASAAFKDRINTAEEYGEVAYIAQVDSPHSGSFESEPESSQLSYNKQ